MDSGRRMIRDFTIEALKQYRYPEDKEKIIEFVKQRVESDPDIRRSIADELISEKVEVAVKLAWYEKRDSDKNKS